MLALDGGLLAVYEEAAEAVAAVEVVHGVAGVAVAVTVHVGFVEEGELRDDREALDGEVREAGVWLPSEPRVYKACTRSHALHFRQGGSSFLRTECSFRSPLLSITSLDTHCILPRLHPFVLMFLLEFMPL